MAASIPQNNSFKDQHFFGLIKKIICPHCWHRFSPGQVLWVSQHEALMGDPVAGEDAARRFLPSRFTHDCHALDSRGTACQQLACPNCHLVLPRTLTKSHPYFLSMVGAPSSGKTWLLTAMTWQLRRILPRHFQLSFNDADTLCNVMLNENESKLFLSDHPDQIINLSKTEEKGGGFYDHVTLSGQSVQLPKPFLFTLSALSNHPHHHSADANRTICLYDNAGESFQPGRDTAANPTTQHLAQSRAIMFLYDPTQDPRFREQCRKFSADPQLLARPKSHSVSGDSAMSQHTLLLEAAQRVRRYANLPSSQKYGRPLLMLVSKSDTWAPLLDEDIVTEPYLPAESTAEPWRIDMNRITRISAKIRRLLQKWTPEIVTAAEEFSSSVVYIPVSALGGSPEAMEGAESFGARPANIKPRWATVPFIFMFARWTEGTITHAPDTAAPVMPSPTPESAPASSIPSRNST